MPRLHPRLLRQAHAIDGLVARLLPVCRDLPSAQRELRWIREHARRVFKESSSSDANRLTHHYVWRRSRGEPLQYILGTEFFGDLEIKCRHGVLIPRQETAAAVTNLVQLLSCNVASLPPDLRVLDLCTGSGCIPLLFHHEFYYKQFNNTAKANVFLKTNGVDISQNAVNLARENQALQISAVHSQGSKESSHYQSLKSMAFLQADVLQDESFTSIRELPSILQALVDHNDKARQPACNILISNPPYISSSGYWRTTSPSVRRFEPKLALVPPTSEGNYPIINDQDFFYNHILRTAQELDAQIVLVEVADLDQAKRVAAIAVEQSIWDGVEIWRDDPARRSPVQTPDSEHQHNIADFKVPMLGSGNGRCVLAYRGRGAAWLGRT